MDGLYTGSLTGDSPNTGGISHLGLLPSEDRRRIKRQHLLAVVKEEVAFLTPWRILTQMMSLFAIIALAGFIYTGFGNSAFTSLLFPQKHTDYGIVIDAGSHGSRLYLYEWPARIHDPDHPLTGPITFPTEIFGIDVAPGISSMAEDENKNPDDAGEVCIKPLLSQLMTELVRLQIPEDQWTSFPIFLKATAGMRNLDILTRARIMNSIRRYLANDTEVPFAFQWSWARVIAGEEEGVYGWLTVNNALNTILLPANQTVGAIDMGGASTQITFSPVHTSVIEGYYGMNLGGQTIRLYSHSFLGYGWGDAMMRLTTRLAVESVLNSPQLKDFPLEATHQFLTHILGPYYNSSLSTTTSRPHKNPQSLATKNIAKTSIMITPEEFYSKDKESSAKKRENSTSTAVLPEQVTKIVNLTAIHPCYLKGHKFSFSLPSLVYPDGRFYIDLDMRELILYMRSLGIPEQYLRQIVPKNRSPPTTTPPSFLMDDEDLESLSLDVFRGRELSSGARNYLNYKDEEDNAKGNGFYIANYQANNNILNDGVPSKKRFSVSPSKFSFKQLSNINNTDIRNNHSKPNHEISKKKVKDSIDYYPLWLLDEDLENVTDMMGSKDEETVSRHANDDLNSDSISSDNIASPNKLLDFLNSRHQQASSRRLKATKQQLKKSSDDNWYRNALLSKHSPQRYVPADSTFEGAVSMAPDGLYSYSSSQPYKPLDVPFPLEAAPKIQWIINFEGGSDFDQCQQRARSLLYNEPCFIHSCSFNGVYQPRLEDSQFIAFGQFAKVQTALNVSSRASLRQLEDATSFVQKQRNRFDAQKMRRELINLMERKAIWSHTILAWGYGFNENSTNIKFSQGNGNGTNESAVGWATGSMVYEVNNFPWKSPIGKFELPFLWATLCAVLFVLTTAFMAMEIRVYHRILSMAGLTSETMKVTHDTLPATSPAVSGDATPEISSGYTQLI